MFYEDGVDDLEVAANDKIKKVTGVATSSGQTVKTNNVVVTTGTFLKWVVHIGPENFPAGRFRRSNEDGVEAPTTALAKTFNNLGFSLGRLNTGTPPRIKQSSIDFDGLVTQPSEMDDDIHYLSF